jgi:hypothetical protein
MLQASGVRFAVVFAIALSLTSPGLSIAGQNQPATGTTGTTGTSGGPNPQSTGGGGNAPQTTQAQTNTTGSGQSQSTTAQNTQAYGTLALDLGGAFAAAWAAIKGSNSSNSNNTTNIHPSPSPSSTAAGPASPAPAPSGGISANSVGAGRTPHTSSFHYDGVAALNHSWSTIGLPSMHPAMLSAHSMLAHVVLEYNGKSNRQRDWIATAKLVHHRLR